MRFIRCAFPPSTALHRRYFFLSFFFCLGAEGTILGLFSPAPLPTAWPISLLIILRCFVFSLLCLHFWPLAGIGAKASFCWFLVPMSPQTYPSCRCLFSLLGRIVLRIGPFSLRTSVSIFPSFLYVNVVFSFFLTIPFFF